MADLSANTDFGKAVRHGIKVQDRAGLNEARRAGAEHFERSELGRQAFIGWCLGHVHRDQPAKDICLPIRIVRDNAPGQRFTGKMNMTIDESGCDDEAIAVQRLLRSDGFRDLAVLANAVNAVSAQGDCAVAIDPALRIHGDDPRIADEQVNGGRVVHVHLIPSGCSARSP